MILAIELTPTYFASANTTFKTVFEPMFDLLADRLVVTVGRGMSSSVVDLPHPIVTIKKKKLLDITRTLLAKL